MSLRTQRRPLESDGSVYAHLTHLYPCGHTQEVVTRACWRPQSWLTHTQTHRAGTLWSDTLEPHRSVFKAAAWQTHQFSNCSSSTGSDREREVMTRRRLMKWKFTDSLQALFIWACGGRLSTRQRNMLDFIFLQTTDTKHIHIPETTV